MQDRVRRQQLQPHLDKVLPCNGLEEWQKGQRLVCVDFGSMGSMGLIPGPARLVSMLSQVLIATNTKGILLTGRRQIAFVLVPMLAAACWDLASQ